VAERANGPNSQTTTAQTLLDQCNSNSSNKRALLEATPPSQLALLTVLEALRTQLLLVLEAVSLATSRRQSQMAQRVPELSLLKATPHLRRDLDSSLHLEQERQVLLPPLRRQQQVQPSPQLPPQQQVHLSPVSAHLLRSKQQQAARSPSMALEQDRLLLDCLLLQRR